MDVGGETILGRALRLLEAHGVRRVVLASGYREDAVRAAVRGTALEVVFCRNPEFDSTQNSVSLWHCREALSGVEAFFKLDGDVVFADGLLARLDACAAPLAVAVDGRRGLDAEAMKVRVGQGRRIEAFGKGLPVASAAGESIGIERLRGPAGAALFAGLRAAIEDRGRRDLYYEDVYSELIGEGRLRAEAVEVSDLPWTEVDTLEDLRFARELLARQG